MKSKMAYSAICTGLLALMFSAAYADPKPSAQPAVTGEISSQVKKIEHVMKAQFEKPDAPLKVFPVTVEGDYAVAGWVQNKRGGRALLKKHADSWTIVVCGGDGLRNADVLVQTGMSVAAADMLAKKVQHAEFSLSKQHLSQLALFEGVVKIEAGKHHGATAQHKSH